MNKHIACFLFIFTLSAGVALSQVSVKGRVVDASDGEPLAGATVSIPGAGQGCTTGLDGRFSLSVAPNSSIRISHLGYRGREKSITGSDAVDFGVIMLETDEYALDDVIITSSVAVARKTPVALSSISSARIEEKIGMQDFPEMLKAVPGIYSTRKGGGYGDSELRLRGFKSENIAVMVNGIPVNDMEWGSMYWSNWAGLADVSRSVQVQRGLGASKVSAPSVGGSVNIITATIDAQKGGFVSCTMGDHGYSKIMFKASTGLTDKGWALTLLGGRTWGDGYIRGTEFDGYSYFINVARRISERHRLSFTAFGAPQWHNQRNKNDGLTIDGWQQVRKYTGESSAFRYNPAYGYGIGGERKTSSKNAYHKPQISLNHWWQINETSSLSTAAYLSLGRGYGYSGQGYSMEYRNRWYGASYGALNMQLRQPDGAFAYGDIYAMNDAGAANGALMAMSKAVNNHNWYGLLSTYSVKIGKNTDFYGGVDFRYYKGIHTNKLIDLYGADFFIDALSRKNVLPENNSAAADGAAFTNRRLTTGETVYRDYDGYIVQEGVFAQAEHNLEKLNVFVAGSVSNFTCWRYDRFYYDRDHARSGKENFPGFTVKGGANYNLTENHNLFAGIGYISRAPFFSGGVFLSAQVSNIINPHPVNEKIFSAELGYGFQNRFLNIKLNAYHTKWMDKTMTRGIDVNIDQIGLNMTGVDAVHQGIEFDFSTAPLGWLDVTGMFSLGDWRWKGYSTGYFYDSGGQPVRSYGLNTVTGKMEIEHASGVQAADHARMSVDLNGVKVGGSAQTTASLGVRLKPMSGIYLGVDYLLYARNYSDWNFNPSDLALNGSKKYESPWKMPSAGVFDISGGYSFRAGGLDASVSANVFNLFDKEYIVDASDGRDHNRETAYGVFYGFGRTGAVKLRINF
ncbi:MAG: TonB-dependent receptor [Bacteroidales bacterium]|jgi:outer membrane receptor for Fe3+-dicitrate|nr:TonB-dependent receptor [Bacteroidales bacterium]